jgi:hypothetical protein
MTYADRHPDSTGAIILSCLGAAAVLAIAAFAIVPLTEYAAALLVTLSGG